MTPDRWNRVQALFHEALDADDPAARLAAEPDAALRREVERLLAAHREADAFIERPVIVPQDALPDLDETTGDETARNDDAAGERIGPWRILRPIGRGGMGDVFLAERADGAYRQRAALKLVRRGMDSDAVSARFRQERQILAGLDHPGVARLLDGGQARGGPFDGRPYLALEYVDGEPITTYCDRRRLPVAERLHLFAEVGRAVEAAHRRLVVHRDLKPSNILVVEAADGRPGVKLLDFGIAKLLEDDSAGEGAALTRTGVRVLTPGYAAPEQVRGEAVTTATDVFGLGVVLYELLTGSRPFTAVEGTPRAVERAVLEHEPQRPSTVVASDDGASEPPEVRAAARSTAPQRLRRTLAGDLDAVCLKALRKEPEARYVGAAALVDDVQRHLDGLPVAARRGSRAYRARKFARRHRVALAAAALMLVLLAGFAALYTAGVAAERDRAEAEAATAREVTAFVTGLFESARPEEARGDTLDAFDLLARGTERAEALADEPAVQARMFHVLGRTYHTLSRYDDARDLLARSVALHRRHGDADSTLSGYLNDLGNTLEALAAYDEAEAAYEEALALLDDTPRARAATLLDNLGVLREKQGDYEEAERLHRRAVALGRRLYDEADARRAPALNNLAFVRSRLGNYEGAAADYREVLLLLRREHGDLYPGVIATLSNLGVALRRMEAYDEAEAAYREALALSRRLHGDHHFATATMLNNLGVILKKTDRLDEAETAYAESLAIRRRIFGDDHPQVATSLNNLAALRRARGDYDGAEPLYREAIAIVARTSGAEHPRTAKSMTNLGHLLIVSGRTDEAETMLRRALRIQEASLPADHLDVAHTCRHLSRLLLDENRSAEALPLLQRAQTIYHHHGHSEAAEVDSLLALQRVG